MIRQVREGVSRAANRLVAEFDKLRRLFEMRDAIEILWDGLSFDDPLCEKLQPIDEKVCGDYEEAYNSLIRRVEEPYLSPADGYPWE